MSAVSQLIKSQTDNAADGTGIVKLIDITKSFLGLSNAHQIPQVLINTVQGQQQAQFGSYPDHKDIAPSAVFLALFIIFAAAHGFLFVRNWMRGHRFILSFAFCFYCTLRWIGFALRIVWAKDILKLHVGLASAVLLVLPIVFLASFNLVLAQRLFTWKHPVIGNHKWFWILMITLYSIVISVVVMTIVAGVVPYLYFLSRSNYDMCRNVVKVTSVLITLYSLVSLIFVASAFIFPTTKAEKSSLIYQPYWIKSFSPLYFPPKNAAKDGEALFISKFSNDPRAPLRTIVSGGMPMIDNNEGTVADELEEYARMGEQKFSTKHNISILIVTFSSIFVFIGALFRCISCLLDMTFATQSWIFKPVVMYVLWGALETVINVLYLVGRVDLRFYRPDSISKKCIALKENPLSTDNEEKDNVTHSSSHQSSDTRV